MRRPVLVGLLVASVAALIALLMVMRSEVRQSATPVRNITVTLDGENFALQDGVAQRPGAPGSATTRTVRIVGEPVMGDVNGDRATDAALLLADDPGGSGTFYYAVLALNEDGTYQATNALALGDRIEPEDVEFTDGRFVYRFLERKPGEPLAAPPSVDKRVEIVVDPQSNRISARGV